ncbi:MAG: 2-oxoacid:acceptor oxidoreductase family protein [Armatimonadota bacterium]|nr:2-oxoacid:acceptor oxidoreductase family protein [Armatimonadota bacterium]MDR7449696.1 2-oxoacid:acceptor oxidoreductase family protein [Armatimonadota bacterium]MDR7458388.1 2-oxoacid:acceptor oxidoreductase family protein [Armatimonadota bacterium]MDR7478809.1 2-oxoacid:acceptor oxidoreductase family protein [Armatimonadota bacterium]MDR7488832.1 2-oxoacid:acceptor oxidoreductase family protein [Armatimonadota bacterium]
MLARVGPGGAAQAVPGSEDLAREIATRYSHIRSLPDLSARLAAVRDLFFGGEAASVESAPDGHRLWLSVCPLDGRALEPLDACGLARAVLEALTGAEVEQEEWISRGDPRCTFVLRPRAPGADEEVRAGAGTSAAVRGPGLVSVDEAGVPMAPVTRPLTIRWHGRGGYGAKTAATLLAEAVIDAGGFGQAAPEFGPERRGAPVQAFTRLSPWPIGQRGPVERPDAIVILDPRLVRSPTVWEGVTPATWVIINAPEPPALPGVRADRVVALDASRLARAALGRDIPNVPMLAAVVALFTWFDPTAFLRWLRDRLAAEFPAETVEANLRAAQAAMDEVRHVRSALADAS